MRTITLGLVGAAMTVALVAGCGGNHNTTDAGTPHDGTSNTEGGGTGPGTCGAPVELATAGTTSGTTVTYMGTTVGAANNLHPYGGCVTTDDSEVVFHYTVPSGVTALKISTDGSAFNTALYVRTDCSQSTDATAADLACNDDDYTSPPQSTVFLTNLMDSQDLFIVVDGNADATAMMGASNGTFTLTVAQVTLGSMGNPCIPATDDAGNTTGTCTGALACSVGGGAADGTAICTTAAAVGAMCDTRGFTNTCTGGAVCATDPTPPAGTTPAAMCALPGTAAGTACRDTTPPCDVPFVCGAGTPGVCVRTLSAGDECDTTGMSNQCPTGTTCVGTDAGNATCVAH